jgi:hypothetical protein
VDPVARIAALGALNVSAPYAEVWVGEVGIDRHTEEDRTEVRGVAVPWSDSEWCQTCMRDGEQYIEGCCGNTSAMQDRLNGAFRDSGWLDAADLLYVGNLAQTHEGFELFVEGMSDTDFNAHLARWDELDPWEKLGLCYQATYPLLKPRSYELPRLGRPETDEEHSMRALESTLARLDWADLFSDQDERGRQRHANLLRLKAQALGPAQTLVRALEENAERFDGYAVVDPENERVLVDTYGLCIFDNEAEAQRSIELWQRVDEEIGARVVVRPVTVNVQDGVQLI